MKRCRFGAVAFLLLVCGAWAQTASSAPSPQDRPSQEDVLALFKLMHIREQTASMMKGSENQTKASIRDLVQKRVPDITETQLAELDQMVGELYRHYPVDTILGDMVPVYQKHLTKADVNGIAAFYSSPPGQKLLQEMPAMTEEAIQIAMGRMQTDTEDILVKLDQRVQQMAEENRKKREAAPVKGTVQKPQQPQK